MMQRGARAPVTPVNLGLSILLITVLALASFLISTRTALGSPSIPTIDEVQELAGDFELAVTRAMPSVVAVHAYQGSRQSSGGVGSGIVLDDRGHVLTCAHVVEGSDNLKIIASNGKTFIANLIGIDPIADIAVLVVEGPIAEIGRTLLPVSIRDLEGEPLDRGEWIFAMGHPGGPHYDKVPVASCGRLTGVGVQLPPQMGNWIAGGLLQTDLPITSGSSGGPLLDRRGRLLGINNAVSLLDDRAFAIPYRSISDQASAWIEAGGQGYLGVELRELGRRERRRLGIRSGVMVSNVDADRAGARDSLAPGDVLLSIDGKSCGSPYEAGRLIGNLAPGRRAVVSVLRDGEVQVLPVMPTRRVP